MPGLRRRGRAGRLAGNRCLIARRSGCSDSTVQRRSYKTALLKQTNKQTTLDSSHLDDALANGLHHSALHLARSQAQRSLRSTAA